MRAFQSVYGYEYQGDNLILARINLLMTFVEYLDDRWKRPPTIKELKKVANVIVWNFWQMDGLKGTVPLGVPEEQQEQMSWIEDLFGAPETADKTKKTPRCRVYDWRLGNSIPFETVGRENVR